MNMGEVVVEIIRQQIRIYEILDFDVRPVLRPPVTHGQLASLDAWFHGKGSALPPTYREFLLICDGIENFSLSYSLFGAIDILDDAYADILEKCLQDPVGFNYREALRPILIGYSPETTTRVWFEISHEMDVPGEAIVLDGDPGDMTLHASFEDFMRLRIKGNELTINRLLELKSRAAEHE